MTAPPKKRQRLDDEDTHEDDVSVDNAITNTLTVAAAETQAKLHMMIDSLTKQVDDIGSNNDNVMDISLQFLHLKSLQRQLLEKGVQTETILERQARKGQQQALRLDNLNYQQRIHQASITQGKSHFSDDSSLASSNLCRLAASCVEADTDDPSNTIPHYLNMQDWQDPSQRQAILTLLNREMTTRQALQQELEQHQQQLQAKQQSLKSQQETLQNLPQQLAGIEQASLPLQQFVQTMHVSQKTSLPRLERIELAGSLPKALYTLHYQLQACLDLLLAVPSNHEGLPTLTCDSNNNDAKVALIFPVPIIDHEGGVSYQTKKTATITFQYDDSMEAIVASCQTKENDMDALIGELFPGDIGEECGTTNTATTKAYQWCNYLGGLYIGAALPNANTTLQRRRLPSTKAIVHALVLRIRAMATLSDLLSALFSKTVPMHAALKTKLQMEEDTDNNVFTCVQLVSWALLPSSSNHDHIHVRTYEAVLTNQSSGATLTARVDVNMARYPSVPPEWDLTGRHPKESADEVSLDAPPPILYNDALANLEKSINHQCLDQLVVEGDETTYEWILAHQLWELARLWSEMNN
jgi:hypothetical protein